VLVHVNQLGHVLNVLGVLDVGCVTEVKVLGIGQQPADREAQFGAIVQLEVIFEPSSVKSVVLTRLADSVFEVEHYFLLLRLSQSHPLLLFYFRTFSRCVRLRPGFKRLNQSRHRFSLDNNRSSIFIGNLNLDCFILLGFCADQIFRLQVCLQWFRHFPILTGLLEIVSEGTRVVNNLLLLCITLCGFFLPLGLD